MSDQDTADAIVVFTARSPDRLVREGGSQAWVLNPARAKLCTWLVCTQNRHHPNHEFSDATESHGSAFLVGKISSVRESEEDDQRWLIAINEFARVSVPDVWKHWRNPVRYSTLEELGINPDDLDFHPMPETIEDAPETHVPPAAAGEHAAGMLTIAEAKKALAVAFGVKPEAVEITIRG